MSLLIVYVIAIMVGDLFAVGIAEIVERFSEKASLGVFLALYFVVFWVAWRVAVRVTEPRPALSQPAAKP
jgi:NADH:ubiquinone oxidoreductase subunit 6 (subunit J)